MKKQKTMKTQRERENLEQLKKQKKMDRERERERDLSFLVCCLLCAYTGDIKNAKKNLAREGENKTRKRERERERKTKQREREREHRK